MANVYYQADDFVFFWYCLDIDAGASFGLIGIITGLRVLLVLKSWLLELQSTLEDRQLQSTSKDRQLQSASRDRQLQSNSEDR